MKSVSSSGPQIMLTKTSTSKSMFRCISAIALILAPSTTFASVQFGSFAQSVSTTVNDGILEQDSDSSTATAPVSITAHSDNFANFGASVAEANNDLIEFSPSPLLTLPIVLEMGGHSFTASSEPGAASAESRAQLNFTLSSSYAYVLFLAIDVDSSNPLNPIIGNIGEATSNAAFSLIGNNTGTVFDASLQDTDLQSGGDEVSHLINGTFPPLTGILPAGSYDISASAMGDSSTDSFDDVVHATAGWYFRLELSPHATTQAIPEPYSLLVWLGLASCLACCRKSASSKVSQGK